MRQPVRQFYDYLVAAGSDLDRRRALIVEDDDFTRGLLVTAVKSLDFEVEQARSGAEALAMFPDFDLDVALVDLDLGVGPNGVDVLDRIRHKAPWVAGIILTSHRSVSLVKPATASPPHEYTYAVKGDIDSTEKLSQVIDAAIDGLQANLPTAGETVAISERQADLLRLIAEGLSNDEIARRSELTTRSIERSISRLYRTLGLHGDSTISARVEAARLYTSGRVTIR